MNRTASKIKVRCMLCKVTSEINMSTARRLLSKNHGYIPCPECGSHATKWDTKKFDQ